MPGLVALMESNIGCREMGWVNKSKHQVVTPEVTTNHHGTHITEGCTLLSEFR